MPVWSRSKFDCLYYDDDMESEVGLECSVTVEGGEIEMSYMEDQEMRSYKGREVGDGHFDLRGVGFDGHATLHRFPDGKALDGYFVEEGERGMWRVMLAT